MVANLGCCDVNRPCHIGSSRALFQLPICPRPGLCRICWQLTVEGEGERGGERGSKKGGRGRERERKKNGRERERERERERKNDGRERERERERKKGAR